MGLILWPRWELVQTLSLRGRRSRNKVSVGEPAEGSFMFIKQLSRRGCYVDCARAFGRVCFSHAFFLGGYNHSGDHSIPFSQNGARASRGEPLFCIYIFI